MKVLMLGRIGLLEEGGGDLVQIQNTALELKKLGVEVDLHTGLDFNPTEYDLVHIFQLDWTAETNLYARKVKRFQKPLVLSPIHHNVQEVQKFDDLYAFGLRKVSRFLFKDQHSRDTLKNIYRAFSDPQKIIPTAKSVLRGLFKMHQETLSLSDIVLVQTSLEAKDLLNTYKVDFKWKIVPNGVSENFLDSKAWENSTENPLGIKDYLICVGRVEPRKNQLSVIEAVSMLRQELNLDLHLVFVGKISESKHHSYASLFAQALKKNPWIHHVEFVPYNEMPLYYHLAKVGISASWFETTGLTSLEALFCGANAVATGDRVRECLGNLAFYCSPESVFSIKEAIKEAYFAPFPKIPEKMKKLYTWKNVGLETQKVYESLIREDQVKLGAAN